MMGLISFIHITVCLLLIVIVLLQHGKGADAGAAFGGGQSAVFGARGAASFLSKVTTVGAIVFMLTSLMLVYMSAQKASQTVFDGVAPSTATSPSEALEDAAAAGAQQVEDAVDNAAKSMGEDAQDVAKQAEETVKTVVKNTEKAAEKTGEALKEAATKAKDSAKETAETLNEKANELAGDAKKAVEGESK